MVDVLVRQAQDVSFQLNEGKCKDLRISFPRNDQDLDPICANGQTLETEECEIVQGLSISKLMFMCGNYFERSQKIIFSKTT